MDNDEVTEKVMTELQVLMEMKGKNPILFRLERPGYDNMGHCRGNGTRSTSNRLVSGCFGVAWVMMASGCG